MQMTTRQFADTTLARPVGRIDHRSAPAFEAALEPLVAAVVEARGALVLDFSEVDYISSVGLRVLMLLGRRMREGQAKVVLAAMQSVVAEIFSIARFDKVLPIAPTVEAAFDACSPGAVAAFRATRAAG